jgi:hypothetical protein
VLDLFRYSSPGVIGTDGSPNYFSTDGGVTDLGDFNYTPPADYGDWIYPGTGLDAYRGDITLDTVSPITSRDASLMAALGFSEGPMPITSLPAPTQEFAADPQDPPRVLAAGDFTGSGVDDILFVNSNTSEPFEWIMNGMEVSNYSDPEQDQSQGRISIQCRSI